MVGTLGQWAKRWGIPEIALNELYEQLRVTGVPESPKGAKTEAGATTHVRMQASKHDSVLWRNNVGQIDPTSYDGKSFIRYGLANDSKQMNKNIKSSDLIGIRRKLITMDMVGTHVGQFVAREVKKPGWKYSGTAREEAQLRYIELVISMGGDGAFTTGNY